MSLSPAQRRDLESYFSEVHYTDRYDEPLAVLYRHDDDERRILVGYPDPERRMNGTVVKRFRDGESTWSTARRFAEDYANALERQLAGLDITEYERRRFRL